MKNENEKYLRYTKDFDEIFNEWGQDSSIHIRPDFKDVVWDIRHKMKDDVVVKPISMLEYKKVVFQDIVKDMADYYRSRNDKEYELGFQPTDEELIHNRFLQGANRGMKITKALSKAMFDIHHGFFSSKLDYFHKLPYENETYTITANPSKMLDLYYEIETCISPYGCNAHGILYYLVSPYVYIAYSDKAVCRMLVVADHDRKKAFLGSVYGPNNPMMPIAIAKHFVNEGYELMFAPYAYFDSIDQFYLDGSGSMNKTLVEGLGGKFIDFSENENEKNKVDLLERTGWMTFKGDAITGHHNTRFNGKYITDEELWTNNGVILDISHFVCEGCGESYDNEYQSDHNEYLCKYCCEAYMTCEHCDEFIDIYNDDFNAEYCLCESCAERLLNDCIECGDKYSYPESENDDYCPTCLRNIEEAAKAAEEE